MKKLFVVATPIGNLQDISKRALDCLSQVSYILCEDTRVTKKLLSHYKIQTPCKRFDAHSSSKDFAKILGDFENLKTSKAQDSQENKEIALVTDAGTPAISDPGSKLIQYITKRNPEIEIMPIPGPSSLTAALSVSGFDTSQFIFLGFPPAKKGREKFFQKISEHKEVVVIFESVHRIKKTLEQIAKHMPNREIIVARELTKQFETVYRGSALKILTQVKEKGEFVICLNTI